MSTHLLTTSSLLWEHEGSRSLKGAASVHSEWQSWFGKICSSGWKTEKVQNLLALSSFVWDYVQFQTHPEKSTTVINRKSLKVLVSWCSMWHIQPCSRDLILVSCIEQHWLPKCIGPVGARASSDTIPVVPSPQQEETLRFHLWSWKSSWVPLNSFYTPWKYPWLASELLLSA